MNDNSLSFPSALSSVLSQADQDQLAQKGYSLEVTEDGSLSLRTRRHPQTELMHSKRGAWSETLEIYGRALSISISGSRPSPGKVNINKTTLVHSVGLGLGYNEIMLSGMAQDQDFQTWKIFSFETDPFLIFEFTQWLEGRQGLLTPVFEHIVRLARGNRKLLFDLFQSGQFTICEGDFSETWKLAPEASVVFYDAFSSKTSPQLWSEEFLTLYLKEKTLPECLFATYAMTGNLRRALKETNFELLSTQGWGGKKESTLAIRRS